MHRFLPLFSASTLALLASVTAVESPVIGYRGDGSGVFPEDCRPVTRWQEYAGTKEITDHRGNTHVVPDPTSEEVMEHIVWRTPLPNISESSPVAVGRRVVTLCEPGWPVDSGDAPVLVCVDADSGEILWQRPVDQFDLLPPAQQQEAKDLRRRYWHTLRKARELQMRTHAVAASKDEAQIDALIAEAQEAGLRGLAGQMGHKHKGMKVKGHGIGLFAGQDLWGSEFTGSGKLIHHKQSEYAFVAPTWGYTTVGATYATPCSDGETIYAVTAYGCAAAFALDGEPKWLAWLFAPGSGRAPNGTKFGTGACNSPLLTEGGRVLVHRVCGWLWGVDTTTGSILWTYEFPENSKPGSVHGAGEVGTGVVLDIDGTDVYVNTRGKTFRCRDGKLLADPLHENMKGMAHHCLVADRERDVVYFGSGGHSGRKEYGEHSYAVRVLPGEGETVRGELLWQKSREEVGGYIDDLTPVLYQGRLYLGSRPILDAATGAKIGELPGDLPLKDAQGLVVIDGRIWNCLSGDQTLVGSIGLDAQGMPTDPIVNHLGHHGPFDPEQQAKMAAYGTGSIGKWYAWNLGRSYPFASGNRIFYRTADHLYCIGDKRQAFTPSAIFAARQ